MLNPYPPPVRPKPYPPTHLHTHVPSPSLSLSHTHTQVDANIPTGTIFGVYEEKESMDNCVVDGEGAVEGGCLMNTLQPVISLSMSLSIFLCLMSNLQPMSRWSPLCSCNLSSAPPQSCTNSKP